MLRVAIVRGQYLNKWEMQNYEKLSELADVTAFAAYSGLFNIKDVRLRVRRLPSIDPFMTRSWVLNGTIGRPFLRGMGIDRLVGLERALAHYHVVHAAETNLTFTFQAARAKQLHGNRLVSTCWETIPFLHEEDRSIRWRKRYVQRHVDLFLAMSPRAAAALRLEGVPEERIRVLFPGIDLARFRPLPREAGSSLRFWRREDVLRVLFVGRIDLSKGVRDLLLAMAEVVKNQAFAGAVECGLVGSGNQMLIDTLVKRLGLQDIVRYAPALPYASMPELYASADIFVLPSVPTPYWEEQFGMVLAESMACGKAVVSTLSGAIPEVVGDAGVLVPPYDYKALAQAIADLLANDSKRSTLGLAATTRAGDLFDSRTFAEKVFGLYEELVACPANH